MRGQEFKECKSSFKNDMQRSRSSIRILKGKMTLEKQLNLEMHNTINTQIIYIPSFFFEASRGLESVAIVGLLSLKMALFKSYDEFDWSISYYLLTRTCNV